MGKYFVIAKRDGRHGFNLVIESRVTGEVFLLMLESKDPDFPLLRELAKMLYHVHEVREWVKDGIIKFAGDQVVYCKVYV